VLPEQARDLLEQRPRVAAEHDTGRLLVASRRGEDVAGAP
jgi:hypothetical protein